MRKGKERKNDAACCCVSIVLKRKEKEKEKEVSAKDKNKEKLKSKAERNVVVCGSVYIESRGGERFIFLLLFIAGF